MTESDYIIYVDESGDPSLTSINLQYPIFVVAFCILNKSQYSAAVTDLLSLKFKAFGHDQVVIHEREIRKRIGNFAFLNAPNLASGFLQDLTLFVQNAPFTLIAAVIRKSALVRQYSYPQNPYDIARESRGAKEDKNLELAFLRTCNGANQWGCSLPFVIHFSHKQSNSTGMQLADLVARPVGQEVLKPGSQSRIYPVIAGKFRRHASGKINGWGLKVFP